METGTRQSTICKCKPSHMAGAFKICNPGLAKNDVYDPLGRPDSLTNLPDTFFGILGVCMSDPEEDLDQGGRFLLR